jgi:hypothetical protein
MKKLILAGALAVGLSFPLSSQAEVNAFGVSIPLEKVEVSDTARGGYVARHLMDTLKVQTLHNSDAVETVEETEYQNVYTVFGINVSGDQVI